MSHQLNPVAESAKHRGEADEGDAPPFERQLIQPLINAIDLNPLPTPARLLCLPRESRILTAFLLLLSALRAAAPANDAFAAAEGIPAVRPSLPSGSNVDATVEAGEPRLPSPREQLHTLAEARGVIDGHTIGTAPTVVRAT